MKRRSIFLISLLALQPFISAARASQLIDNLKAGKKQTVVAYGTSLTAGGKWVADLQNWLESEYPGRIEVVNSGLSGKASNTGLAQLETRVLAHKPDTVFLEFAVNDAFAYDAANPDQGISPEKCRANLNRLVDTILQANPRAEIILQTMNPFWDAPNGNRSGSKRANLDAYYDVYRQVAAKRGLLLVDHEPTWLKLKASDRAGFERAIPDGAHPTPEASTAITFPALKGALIRRP